ncbi:MAG: hypothetical protein P8L44_21000, partial [Opitutales bacterium]|nr:hypothetical protein [Opitutales bacterium]
YTSIWGNSLRMAKQSPSISESEYRFDRVFPGDIKMYDYDLLSEKTWHRGFDVYEWELRVEVVRHVPELKEFCGGCLIPVLVFEDAGLKEIPKSLVGNFDHYLDLSEAQKADLHDYFENPGWSERSVLGVLEEVKYKEAYLLSKEQRYDAYGLIGIRRRAKGHWKKYSSLPRVHSFIVNWDYKPKEIAKAFENWAFQLHQDYGDQDAKKQDSGKPDPFVNLRNLAMYRLDSAGFSFRERRGMVNWARWHSSEKAFKSSENNRRWRQLAREDIGRAIKGFQHGQIAHQCKEVFLEKVRNTVQ